MNKRIMNINFAFYIGNVITISFSVIWLILTGLLKNIETNIITDLF